MADKYFFALTLKDKNSEVLDPEAKGVEDYQGGHKLIIKQAGGPKNQVLLDLSFPDPPVTSLIQGNGPVHIIGHHLIGNPIEKFDEMDELEEEAFDEKGEERAEEEDEEDEPKTKKVKTANNTKGKTPVKNNLKAKK